ncbi:hypothetical protein [Streptomyces sp. NPDC002537]
MFNSLVAVVVKAAQEAGDVYAATVAAGELEDALRPAREHGGEVEGEQ